MSDHTEAEPRQPVKGLNKLEVRVLAELANGTTDTEVALKLLIYNDVVRQSYRSALKKIGLRDHAQAMAWAKQHLVLS